MAYYIICKFGNKGEGPMQWLHTGVQRSSTSEEAQEHADVYNWAWQHSEERVTFTVCEEKKPADHDEGWT